MTFEELLEQAGGPPAQKTRPTGIKVAQELIDELRNTRRFERADANQKVQMLFDAVSEHHGNKAAIESLDQFAADEDSEDDLKGFKVGNETDGYNVDRSAARHFFRSARLGIQLGPMAAEALGNIKETYDLTIGGPVFRRGTFSVNDLRTNEAGRNLGQHVSRQGRYSGGVILNEFTKTRVDTRRP